LQVHVEEWVVRRHAMKYLSACNNALLKYYTGSGAAPSWLNERLCAAKRWMESEYRGHRDAKPPTYPSSWDKKAASSADEAAQEVLVSVHWRRAVPQYQTRWTTKTCSTLLWELVGANSMLEHPVPPVMSSLRPNIAEPECLKYMSAGRWCA